MGCAYLLDAIQLLKPQDHIGYTHFVSGSTLIFLILAYHENQCGAIRMKVARSKVQTVNSLNIVDHTVDV
jgi:hypothetical protein